MSQDEIVQIAQFIVRALVDDPTAVHVDASVGSAATLLSVRVAPGQAGQLIGKHGRNIEALRTLLQSYGGKANRKVILEFDDGAAKPRRDTL